MLSYRHGFHAGNHADVLKHAVLVALLRLLTQKDKPLMVVDTHGGAGAYSLEEGFAAKNAEYRKGIAALWQRNDMPDPVADYLEQVRVSNPDGVLRQYPGSPQMALQVMRPGDHLRVFELHSKEAAIVTQHFAEAGRRVSVVAGDGFAGMRAVLPPVSRRGLVLIDPSYERVDDYRLVLQALRDAQQRFATGTYVVWYPQIQRRDAVQFPEQLRKLADTDWVDLSLQVKAPSPEGIGLHGSGMFIMNPPWKFTQQMREVLPYLARILGQDSTARARVDARET